MNLGAQEATGGTREELHGLLLARCIGKTGDVRGSKTKIGKAMRSGVKIPEDGANAESIRATFFTLT